MQGICAHLHRVRDVVDSGLKIFVLGVAVSDPHSHAIARLNVIAVGKEREGGM